MECLKIIYTCMMSYRQITTKKFMPRFTPLTFRHSEEKTRANSPPGKAGLSNKLIRQVWVRAEGSQAQHICMCLCYVSAFFNTALSATEPTLSSAR